MGTFTTFFVAVLVQAGAGQGREFDLQGFIGVGFSMAIFLEDYTP